MNWIEIKNTTINIINNHNINDNNNEWRINNNNKIINIHDKFNKLNDFNIIIKFFKFFRGPRNVKKKIYTKIIYSN